MPANKQKLSSYHRFNFVNPSTKKKKKIINFLFQAATTFRKFIIEIIRHKSQIIRRGDNENNYNYHNVDRSSDVVNNRVLGIVNRAHR